MKDDASVTLRAVVGVDVDFQSVSNRDIKKQRGRGGRERERERERERVREREALLTFLCAFKSFDLTSSFTLDNLSVVGPKQSHKAQLSFRRITSLREREREPGTYGERERERSIGGREIKI